MVWLIRAVISGRQKSTCTCGRQAARRPSAMSRWSSSLYVQRAHRQRTWSVNDGWMANNHHVMNIWTDGRVSNVISVSRRRRRRRVLLNNTILILTRRLRSMEERVDLDLRRWPSIPGGLWSRPIDIHKVKVKGHSVQKREQKQTDSLRRLHYLPCQTDYPK